MGGGSRILIAGIGNELRGDDGLGPAVVNELSKRSLPPNVDLLNFGEKLYELLLRFEGYRVAIIIDALDLGGKPGQMYVVEYGPGRNEKDLDVLNPHEADLRAILSLGERLGVLPEKVYIIGCQPEDVSHKIGLSPIVRGKVNDVIKAVEKILGDYT